LFLLMNRLIGDYSYRGSGSIEIIHSGVQP
jgi:hypothetical protein